MAKKQGKLNKQKNKRNQAATIAPALKNTNFLLISVLAITAILFIPALQHSFVNWDDPINILENPFVQHFNWTSIKGIFTSTVIGNYNPLTILSFAIERALFGLNPFVFHLNNILLHLACVFFVYRIAIGLELSPIAAAIVALLFGIHPMRVESVAWITERKDVLYGVFYLSAMYQYIRYLQSNRTNKTIYGSIIFLFVLALFSKIQAVALPLSFLAIDYWLKRPLNWKLVIEKIPYFALSLAVGLLGVFLLSEEGSLEGVEDFTFVDRLFIGGYSYLVYLIKFIYPYELSPIYPYPLSLDWRFYVGTALSISLVAGLIYAFKKGYRVLVFSFAFFTFNIVFLLQIVGAGQGFLADRFTYIPYLGLFIGVGYGYQQLATNKSRLKILQIGLGALCLLYAFMTWQQVKVWKNGETLWTQALKYYDNVVTPWSNRADYYKEQNLLEKAILDYEKAVVVANNEERTTLYTSWGKSLFDLGQPQKAIEIYNLGINLPNPIGEIYINRGVAYASQGQFDLALQDINKGLNLNKDNANGYLNRGLIYYSQNQLSKTIPDLNKYFSMKDGTSNEWYILGLSYRNTGNTEAAIPAFSKAIQLNPSDKRIYNSRGNAYRALGKEAEAAKDFATAAQL